MSVIQVPDDHHLAVKELPSGQDPFGAECKLDKRCQNVFFHYEVAKASVKKLMDQLGLSLMAMRLADPDTSEGKKILDATIKDIPNVAETFKIRLAMRRLCREDPMEALVKKRPSQDLNAKDPKSLKVGEASASSSSSKSKSSSSATDGSTGASSSKAKATSAKVSCDCVYARFCLAHILNVSSPEVGSSGSANADGASQVPDARRSLIDDVDSDFSDFEEFCAQRDEDDVDADPGADGDGERRSSANRAEPKCLNRLFDKVADKVCVYLCISAFACVSSPSLPRSVFLPSSPVALARFVS